LVDFIADVSTTTRTANARVNGTGLGPATQASTASTFTNVRIGKNVDTTTANVQVRYDDLVVSATEADYPLGEHEVLALRPNADGTHSFTANDFIRGDAGAAILVSATDVWTLLDDEFFGTIGTSDSVQQNVIRTTGYVEFQLDPAPRTVDAWGIQIHGQYDADATGASTVTLKENDGGTLRDVYTNADVSNTTETFLSHCRTTAPSGGAYTQAKLDALRLRWGYSGDVTGSPIVHALMVEAAFPVSAGPTIVEADGAASCAATVSSVAAALWNGVTAAAGLAGSTVAGAALWLSIASAPGVATVGAASVAVASRVAASAGTATASAEGADGASTGSDASAAGNAAATGVGGATAGAAGVSAGTAQAVVVGASVVQASGASSGVAAASAEGADGAIPGSDASASGSATVTGVGGSTAGVQGASAGVATVVGTAPASAVQESGSGGRARKQIRRAVAQLLRGGLPVPGLRLGRLLVVNPTRVTLARVAPGSLDFGLGLRRGQLAHRAVLAGRLVPQASYRGTVGFAPRVRDGRTIALAPLDLVELLEVLGIYELAENG
jgi:hypothetical protein